MASRETGVVGTVRGAVVGMSGMSVPCGGLHDLFFSSAADDQARAAIICGACPVRTTCLQGALDRREAAGIWGGFPLPKKRQDARRWLMSQADAGKQVA